MSDKVKNILRWSGVGAIVVGAGLAFAGGATESMATLVVAGVFTLGAAIAGAVGVLKIK